MNEPKIWTREEIINKLNTSDRWVERAILRLWHGQTTQEQREENTYDHNDIGFSAVAARVGSYMGKWVQSGKPLTGKWLAKARKIALRHVRQLVKYANRDAIAQQEHKGRYQTPTVTEQEALA